MELERANRHFRSQSGLVFLLCVIVACLPPAVASPSRDYIVDQSNTWYPVFGTANNIDTYAPVGQEFVPSFSSLEVVEFLTDDFNTVDGLGAELIVRVRSGSIYGEILGTSLPVLVPSEAYWYATRFVFMLSVPLVPGDLYVIELVRIGGGPWGFNSDGAPGDDPYPFGCTILWGQPQPHMDSWFTEGIVAVSPVESVTWGAVKALYRH